MKTTLYFSVFAAIFCACFLVSTLQAQTPYGMGLTIDKQELDAYQKGQLAAEMQAKSVTLFSNDQAMLPKLSWKKFYPQPYQQSGETCSVGAAVYGACTMLEAMYHGWIHPDTIAAHAFSPAYVYTHLNKDKTCSSGLRMSAVLQFLKINGAVKCQQVQDQLNSCHIDLQASTGKNTNSYKIHDFEPLIALQHTATAEPTAILTIAKQLKKALLLRGAVVIGMVAPDNFYQLKTDQWLPPNAKKRSDFYKNNAYTNGHAVSIVAYDDDKHGGAFQIMNSWGTDWGNGGFTWISYEDLANWIIYAYAIYPYPHAGIITILDEGKKDTINIIAPPYSNNNHHLENSCPSGTVLNLLLSNHAPAYIYVFGTDDTQMVDLIYEPTNIKPNRTDVTVYCQLNYNPGNDQLLILYTKYPIEQVNEFTKLLAKGPSEKNVGKFKQRAIYAINQEGYQLINSAKSDFQTKQNIVFKSLDDKGDAAFVIIDIDHVD